MEEEKEKTSNWGHTSADQSQVSRRTCQQFVILVKCSCDTSFEDQAGPLRPGLVLLNVEQVTRRLHSIGQLDWKQMSAHNWIICTLSIS